MDRLTKWVDVDGAGELEAVQVKKAIAQTKLNGPLELVNVESWREVLDRLAQYEDMGTVEQCAAVMRFYERIVPCEERANLEGNAHLFSKSNDAQPPDF